jgi:ribosomal 50S subunit-associated protein YjgA (DUF615 family)
MESDSVAFMQADVAAMRGDIGKSRQDYSVLDARVDALENWRERYLAQEDKVLEKLFSKIDELTAALSEFRANLSRLRGERDAERRVTIMIVSLLSALCGGVATNFLHVSAH